MTNRDKSTDRDAVLLAFHQAYVKPTAAEIAEWTFKYPDLAEDIIAHAAVSYDWAADKAHSADEPSKEAFEAAFSRALSALYVAEAEAEDAKPASAETLQDIARECGKDVRAIQRQIETTRRIDRGVLADFFNGAMLEPLSRRFSTAVREALEVTQSRFEAAHRQTLLCPRMGLAKARAAPTINQRTCEDIFRSSDMTPDLIAYWLDEDV
jgi:hypothetical protein